MKRSLFVACLLIVFASLLAAPVTLQMITEDYPPFNFEQDGQVTGISVDLLAAILAEAGSTQTIDEVRLMPWARGYSIVQEQPNTMLFATTRSQEREEMFQWVGPIADTKIVLLAKKGQIQFSDLDELKAYRIGTVRDDIGEQLLVQAGFNIDDLDRGNNPSSNVKKLAIHRIDIFAYEESVAKWKLKEIGESPEDYEVLYVLSQSQLYYALHKETLLQRNFQKEKSLTLYLVVP